MTDKILFVDDDTNLLAAYERSLRKYFRVEIAAGGEAALQKIQADGPYALVVADRQMPGMDGIRLLAKVRELTPETVRLMLTGNADLETAIRVVNEGNIFRFLTKPCPPEELTKALNDALAQYRLVTAEKELLNKTLNGSIRLLTDILSMIDPDSFGRILVLRDAIAKIAGHLSLSNVWEIHLAVMLAPIGCITIPPHVLVKARTGAPLQEAEAQMLRRVPESTARLLANIPRLEGVARIVRHQHARYDDSSPATNASPADSVPVGSRLLKILSDMVELEGKGWSRLDALNELNSRQGWYDPSVLAAVRTFYETGTAAGPRVQPVICPTPSAKLETGMVLRRDVEAKDGTVVLPAGQQLNEMGLEKIQNFARAAGIKEPIMVEPVEQPIMALRPAIPAASKTKAAGAPKTTKRKLARKIQLAGER